MDRNLKMANLLKELGASFLGRESNNSSLITVTSCTVSPDFKKSTLFITIIPETKEKSALQFAKRKRGELREFLKKNLEIKTVPFIEIEIDKGEKHRQKIDELLRNG
ncbi:MAG: ribosome-binding factor A [Patescibacteria group bacterium]